MSNRSETLLDLSLARGSLDRAAHGRREPGLLPRLLTDPATRVIDLRGDKVRVLPGTPAEGSGPAPEAPRLRLRAASASDADRLALFLGLDGDDTAYVAVLAEPEASSEAEDQGDWRTLREVGALLDDRESGLFTAALALANWHAAHPHCPRCGGPTSPTEGGWVRHCERDGSDHYPRTDMAVIMAVTDPDDRLLLARGPHWAQHRLSVLAGFVEPGETLEAAVAREVAEEVGLVVGDLRYRGNQPWPFPSSLMVGFTARASETRLRLDPVEIAEAAWFTREELGARVAAGELGVPPRVSIARHLIEDWYGGPLTEPVEHTGPFRTG